MSGTLPELSAPAIVGARRSDLPSIRWLLDIELLPSADITEESLEHFLVYRGQLGVAGVALELLQHLGFPTEDLRSKSWDEFATPNGQHFDFVFTVCNNAAGEACPYWPGQPMTAHWGIPDPAAVEGTDMEKSLAFREALRSLEMRIRLFLSLPLASIERMRLKQRLDEIGKIPPEST
jgi:hypothetical protein